MHKRGYLNGNMLLSLSIFLISDLLLIVAGCRNSNEATGKSQIEEKSQITNTETYPLFVKYRSFQNPDSTWGYTIFVNSKPYLHYSRIASYSKGFDTKHDAEIVAGILVRMIQNGEMTPRLGKKVIDSLNLKLHTNQIKK